MSDIAGWDIGGAHLKMARVRDRRIVEVRLLACPLWQGIDRLTQALDQATHDGAAGRHAVTMTAELCDLFADRAAGVRAVLELLRGRLRGEIMIYGAGEFLDVTAAMAMPQAVASANWHAAARYAAARCGDGLLVDIGSTTSDLVPLIGARVAARGPGDAERLASGELVYSGVVRTPLMALARHVFVAGARVGVMAEAFATTADVHRLTGALPETADQHATADGRGKSPAESRARLARMIGRDAAAAPDAAWDELARQFAGRQLQQLEDAAAQVLSAAPVPRQAPVIGAGVGRFLAAALAQRLERPYRSFAEIVPAESDVAEAAADCAPAAAVGLLLATMG